LNSPDFDEAVKLGDWIVVFSDGAHIVQSDTPERILAEPANEFVENFIGSGAGLTQLTLSRVSDVTLADAVTAHPGEVASEVLARIVVAEHNHVIDVETVIEAITSARASAAASAAAPTGTNSGEIPVITETVAA